MKKVSVVITSYCGSDNLARAIDSALGQTYENVEVIVVDDNDPKNEERKNTEVVMEAYHNNTRVCYIKHPRNMNGSAARNTGVAAAKGEYIQFLDDDDYFFPTKIEKSVMALEQHPECSMVITGSLACDSTRVADLSGALKDSDDCKISKEWLLRFNALGTGSNLFATKDSINAINGFDATYPRMQDIEFIFRYNQQFKVCAISDRLIVKHLNKRPVKIDTYRKHEAFLEKFITQFKDEIIRLLGEADAEKWLMSQAAHLFRIAVSEGEKESIVDAVDRLRKYRNLTIAEKLKKQFPGCWIMIKNNAILQRMKYRKDDTSVELENYLSKDELIEFNKFKQRYLIGEHANA